METISTYETYWDDAKFDDPFYAGMFFVIGLTVVILFVVVSILVDYLPDHLSEKVSKSTPFIFGGIPILVGLIYAFVFN